MLKRFFLLSYLLIVVTASVAVAQELRADGGGIACQDFPIDDPELAGMLLELTPDDLNAIEKKQAALTLSQKLTVLSSFLKLRTSYVRDNIGQHMASHKKSYTCALSGAIVALTGAIVLYYIIRGDVRDNDLEDEL